jgi:Xaa-Pro aminopeptidase
MSSSCQSVVRVSVSGVSRFSSDVYARRLYEAGNAAAAMGLAGLIVTPGYDLRYLVGSRAQTFERLTALVLPVGRAATVVVPRLELASLKDSAVTELGLQVRDWVDGEDPYRLVIDALGGAPVRTAVTDSMPALHLLPLAELLGATPVLATNVLRQLRMIKDHSEIDALRKAGAAIDRVHARVPDFLVPGRTEADVAADIAQAIVGEGHSDVAFIIVGSGPHGADPHHECSDRVLKAGDIVVVDIGGAYEPGYHSDSTRTYSLGEPDPEVAQQYSILQRAQQAAVAASASRCTRSRTSWRATGCRYVRGWRFPSSRESTSRGGGVPVSKTSWWSPRMERSP